MIKNIQVSVEIPDPIDEVYVVSTKTHGTFGNLIGDHFGIAPMVFTNAERAKEAMTEFAQSAFKAIDKVVNGMVDHRKVFHPEAMLHQTTWEASVYISPNDGKSHKEYELPLQVTFYVHRAFIDNR